jgi:hypothetical protein
MINGEWMYLICFSFLYTGLILLYVMIARKFQLTDVPSLRSSHQNVTITGAGFIFPIDLPQQILGTTGRSTNCAVTSR